MGFFKRILSLGSKKSRRKQPQAISSNDVWVDEVGAQANPPPPIDEDNEIAANLLLRSSSARYAVVAETDYSALPPLPHPINSAVSTPTGSTSSLPIPNVVRRGTYTVKVYPRQQHPYTVPLGSRGLDDDNEPQTPQPRRRAQTVPPPGDDSSHLQGLRRDPSVASLLDLYDEHGHLPSRAFSNTPPREGRAQTQRGGSTLRELLGESGSNHNASSSLEGDISWAERFLGEAHSAASSVSSLILQTPENLESRFSDSLLISNVYQDSTYISDHDHSSSYLENPAISSMEVELSAESSQIIDAVPYVTENPLEQIPKTPRRASEVFGFLTERRKSRASEEILDRSLPEPPSTFSSPSDKDSSEGPMLSRFSVNSSEFTHNTAMASHSFDGDIHSYETSPSGSHPVSVLNNHPCDDEQHRKVVQPAPTHDVSEAEDAQMTRKVKVIMVGPTKVIVTAPTPLADTSDRPTSRIPRRPSSLHRRRSRTNTREHQPGLIERDLPDPFTPIPSRPMKLIRTSVSSASLVSTGATSSVSKENRSSSKSRRHGSTRSVFDKENSNTHIHTLGLAVMPDIPFTPVRTNSSRSALLRSVVTPGSFKPPAGMTPSPASSSELSPVGKMMMMDVRRQKSRMREREERGRNDGSSRQRKHQRTERAV
ncbi:hypothetical protein BDP27DRAFT_1321915 [Rhodocollybia butyracea]|uniref:Uncharacterized protein n=1 Tax=Rhodocollybia butyracea TaxID=206335 RepID=A0A9P5UAX7_9AGAR|nr:hypothetical protein BDP27DRAFT_1321915 [Rhodocollybia butyracea]